MDAEVVETNVDNNVVVVEDKEFVENEDIQDNEEFQNEALEQTPAPNKIRPRPKKRKNNFRNDRYNDAYGDYSGGYCLPGGFGRNFQGPPRNFGPPPPMFMPQGPPPPFMWGRGFGPEGPPMRRPPIFDRTIKYLMRCGVGKEHLKNLPQDLLQLMEPEYCGLCAQSFDSFAISRMHYICKNHLKNQKKWINQHSEVGPRRGKEIALKARELYCELCDVHITSKSHSDSHYAGKPHRSIVVGNKNPKNPFLLQRGMEDRVAQLIRREKRHLKNIDEEEVIEKATEIKIAQPDLYCEICKTSMTCSEQMTMHLNGKKHLNKEKQHILKMMKGDSGAASGGAADAGSGGEAEEEEPNEDMEVGNGENEGAEKQGAAQDDADWGDGGGGTWDEELQKDDIY